MIIVFIAFLILLIIGAPAASVIGTSGAVFFLQNTHFPLTHVAQPPLTQVRSIFMLATPLFILAGNLVNNGGVTKRLVSLTTPFIEHMRDGLVQTSVVFSTLTGGVSGSTTAGAVMETYLLGLDMIKSGYSEGFSANVLTFIPLITVTIPPGVGLIIHGTIGSVSIGKLFSVDIFTGLYMMIVLMVSVVTIARMRGYKPVRRERAILREIGTNLKETIRAIMSPVTLPMGIRMEFFSPPEMGAFACFYSVFAGAFVYKELAVQSFFKVLKDSIGDIGSIVMIVFLTTLLGYGIPIDRIPQKVTVFTTETITDPVLVLVLIIILLVFVGMFMEGSVVILLLTPILLPTRRPMGIGPAHLGFLMCVIVTMGVNAPLIRISMYTVNTILDCSLQEYTESVIPLLAVIPLAIELLAFFPDVVLFLPRLLYQLENRMEGSSR